MDLHTQRNENCKQQILHSVWYQPILPCHRMPSNISYKMCNIFIPYINYRMQLAQHIT